MLAQHTQQHTKLLKHSELPAKHLTTYRGSTGKGLRAAAKDFDNHVQVLKADIRKAVTGTSRGKKATSEQQERIKDLLIKLEECNSEQDPVSSPNLSGWWALLYQAPLDIERARVDKSGTLEGPFLAAFQPATKDLVRTKANIQLLDLQAGRAENVAQFVVAGKWQGELNIKGTAVPMEPEKAGQTSRRVLVQFTQFDLKLGSWSTTIPLDWVSPKGWIETTYLDDNFRIGRGDKGSIFVAAKLKDRNETVAE